MSSAIASPRGASAGSTQVVSESALTAIGSVPGRSCAPSSRAADSASASTWRASRSTASPESVTRIGFERTSSTRPVAISSARMRWLTADGVTCSTRAAASKVPSDTAAASARSWARSRSINSDANDSAEC